MDRNISRYGTPNELPEGIPLRAGPLELIYQAGDLRYIRLGEREVVRRIYFAARDHAWGTPPNAIERCTVEKGSHSFRIIIIAHTRQDEVGIHWQAEIKGEADGTITYALRARAERTFMSNRVGLCLLHPARECAGARCRITHTDDSLEPGRFPEHIAPHQPFMDIRAIAHQVAEGVWATATLEGETFEMEDQRNWTDASWKTYSRPLALPIPFEVRLGQRIDQTITLRLEDVPGDSPAPVRRVEMPLTASVGPSAVGVLPPLGLGASSDASASEQQVARLRDLAVGHLRVELALDTPDELLDSWADEARRLNLPLELALAAVSPLGGHLAIVNRATAWLHREKLPVARILLCTGPAVDAAQLLTVARASLADLTGGAPIGVGVSGYFTNLNRERPRSDDADLVFYSLNPQVHAFDNGSLVETLPTQAETVRSAQALYPGLPVAVTPITLQPRRTSEADPRQMSLLGAGWTLGSIASLAAADVGSLTYYQTVGLRGVMAGPQDAPALFPAQAGDLYPIYHLLRWLAGWRGAEVWPVAVSDPLRLQGLALRRGAAQRVILANVSHSAAQVELASLGVDARMQRLDEDNVEAARRGELGAPAALSVAGGQASLTLPPYGLVCIDSTATWTWGRPRPPCGQTGYQDVPLLPRFPHRRHRRGVLA
jgi:hypothetical protein